MPSYQLHRLSQPGGDPDPATRAFFDDATAMRFAMSADFSQGCDVWQGTRYVGRVHGPAAGEASAQVTLADRAEEGAR